MKVILFGGFAISMGVLFVNEVDGMVYQTFF